MQVSATSLLHFSTYKSALKLLIKNNTGAGSGIGTQVAQVYGNKSERPDTELSRKLTHV